MIKKTGHILAEWVLGGDLTEAVWPKEFWALVGIDDPDTNQGCRQYNELCEKDPIKVFKLDVAATILKLTDGGEGGKCSRLDDIVSDILKRFVEVDTESL